MDPSGCLIYQLGNPNGSLPRACERFQVLTIVTGQTKLNQKPNQLCQAIWCQNRYHRIPSLSSEGNTQMTPDFCIVFSKALLLRGIPMRHCSLPHLEACQCSLLE